MRTKTLVGLAVGLLLVGCSSTPEPEAAPTPATTTSTSPAAPPTPEPASSTATETEPSAPAPAETEPAPDLPLPSGRDWEEVVQRILDIQTAAIERNEPNLLLKAYASSCECYRAAAQTLRERSSAGQAAQYSVRPEVLTVDSVEDDGTLVTVAVTARSAAFGLFDADGSLVGEGFSEEVEAKFVLARVESTSAEQRWAVVILANVVES